MPRASRPTSQPIRASLGPARPTARCHATQITPYPLRAPPPKKKKARKRGEMRVAEGNGEAARKGPREAEAVLPRPRFPQAALLRCAIRGPLPVKRINQRRKLPRSNELSAAVYRKCRGALPVRGKTALRGSLLICPPRHFQDPCLGIAAPRNTTNAGNRPPRPGGAMSQWRGRRPPEAENRARQFFGKLA